MPVPEHTNTCMKYNDATLKARALIFFYIRVSNRN